MNTMKGNQAVGKKSRRRPKSKTAMAPPAPFKQVPAPYLLEIAWQSARIALAVSACTAAAYVVTGTLWTTIHTYTQIIYWDMWGWITTLRAWLESGFTWSSLFALDAEHRIVVSRLLFLLGYLLDSQTCALLIALMLAQYFATVGVLVALFRRAAEPEDADRIATITFTAFAGVMLFAGSILEIIQFVFPCFPMDALSLSANPLTRTFVLHPIRSARARSMQVSRSLMI